MDKKAMILSTLTTKVCTYRQFLNFIRQPKNWLAIAVNIAAVAVCAWSIRYGLNRPFDLEIFSVIVALGIIFITGSMIDSEKHVNKFADNCITLIAMLGGIVGTIVCFGGNTILFNIISGVLGFIIGAIVSIILTAIVSISITSIVIMLWERHKKYCLPIVLAIVTFTILLASSFQNVDARSWKFDRGTGKLVTQAVFILPGSTLEREYFVVERKPLKEVSVWILVPAIVDAGWSGDRKQNSLRKEVVLTLSFKNYKSYEAIHYEKIPELRVNTAPSRAQAPEAVREAFFWQMGLTSKDVEINKVDGLE